MTRLMRWVTEDDHIILVQAGEECIADFTRDPFLGQDGEELRLHDVRAGRHRRVKGTIQHIRVLRFASPPYLEAPLCVVFRPDDCLAIDDMDHPTTPPVPSARSACEARGGAGASPHPTGSAS